MKLKLFYSLKRKVLAVCLAGMILMALCVGGISLWTISHLTYDYENPEYEPHRRHEGNDHQR